MNNPKLATYWHRLLAFVLDIIVPFAGVMIGYGVGFLINEDVANVAGIILIILYIIFFYFVLIVRRSQTIGKYFLNIYVVNKNTDKKISVWRYWLIRDIVGRTLVIGSLPILDLFFEPIYFLIDSLFIFRKDRRTLHDMIANTKVVYVPEDKRRKKLLDFSRI